MNFIRKMKLDIIFVSAVLVGLGVVMLLWPDKTQSTICYVLAAVAVAAGLCFVVDYIRKEAMADTQRYVLAIAMTAVLIGVSMFVKHDEIMAHLPVVLSFLILFSGTAKFQNSWDMKRLKHGTWIVHAIIALIGIVYGFILMIGVIKSNMDTWIGVGLIYSGFTDLVSAFVLARIRKVIGRKQGEVNMSNLGEERDEEPAEENT